MVISNTTRVFSPVTMSQDWPTLGRLVFLTLFSTIGTLMNGFYVAAFITERSLRRIGNVYLACTGLSDLIITTIVMPTSVVVLLSGEWDTLPVCQALQFLTETSTYAYSLFFTLIAVETYYRLCRSDIEYRMFISMHAGFVSFLVFLFSAIIAGIGVYMNLDYDYCERVYRGCFLFRATTLGALHALPFFIIMYGLFTSVFCISRRARSENHYRRSQQYDRDCSTTNLNILAYMLYVIGWIPYLVVMYEYPGSSDARYYNAVWAGMMRSVISSLVYCGIDRNFRHAFARLFYYCCCKSSLTDTMIIRHRRILEYTPATGEVRVHIMHQALSTSSPQRFTAAVRDTQEL